MNVLSLLYNLTLLIALSSLSNFIHPFHTKQWMFPCVQGILFGLVAIVGMLYPFSLYEGVFFDGRTVVILLSGYFFGLPAVAVTVALTFVFRFLQGGDGMLPGMVVILFTGFMALGWRRFVAKVPTEVPLVSLIVLSLLSHSVMVLGIFLLPFNVSWVDVSSVAFPVLVLYPLATALSGAIIRNSLHRDQLILNLQETSQLLMEAQRLGKVGGWMYDHQIERLFLSEFGYQILGISSEPEHLRYRDFLASIHPDDQNQANSFFYQTLASQEPSGLVYDISLRMDPAKTGLDRWVRLRWYHDRNDQGNPLVTRGMSQDITEQVHREQQLEQFSQEKEILLREVLHRTRNNMQIILGLLNLRAQSIPETRVKLVLEETSHRVLTMSYIQQQIYDAIHVSGMDGREFLADLLQLLRQTYPSKVVIVADSAADCNIPLVTAVPLGMVIHELVSNTLIHADPRYNDQSNPAIIRLFQTENKIHLIIEDHGDENSMNLREDQRGLGLLLAETIIQEQIGGEVQLREDNGICWEIIIPVTS